MDLGSYIKLDIHLECTRLSKGAGISNCVYCSDTVGL